MSTTERDFFEVRVSTEECESHQPFVSTTKRGTDEDHIGIQVMFLDLCLPKNSEAHAKQREAYLFYLSNQHGKACGTLHKARALHYRARGLHS